MVRQTSRCLGMTSVSWGGNCGMTLAAAFNELALAI